MLKSNKHLNGKMKALTENNKLWTGNNNQKNQY